MIAMRGREKYDFGEDPKGRDFVVGMFFLDR